MERVIHAVERLNLISEEESYGLNVDRSIQQGREAIFDQLVLRENAEFAAAETDSIIDMIQHMLAAFHVWIEPYQLPEDYAFFLRYFGGLWLEAEPYTMVLNGTGPMLEDWYTSLMGDNAIAEPGQDGVLTIGFMSFVRDMSYTQVYFLLDLAGIIYPNAVLGVPYAASIDYKPEVIIKHLRELPTYWNSVATSFTEFLELAATTRGSLGYL